MKSLPIILVLAGALYIASLIATDYYTTEDVVIKVDDKHIYGTTGEKFQIITKEEIFSLNPDIISGFAEAAEVYGSIQKGSCYKVFIRGNRRKQVILPSYRNIEKAEEVPCIN